jgi:hypothetical protein
MSDWTAGYVADIDYTHGYYSELNPLRARLALINAGFIAPRIRNACELGFGQGVSINVHAATSHTEWHGTDFNPTQAAFAQTLNDASGAGARLYDEAFETFFSRPDLPEFDYIGLHGIWSWISPENRDHIANFIQRKLRVGGVLYISYNTQPGWSSFVPVRNLMTQYARQMCVPALATSAKVEETLEFIDKFLQTNPKYLRANPLVTEKFAQVKGQNRHYLAHEYFNRDWFTTSFSAIAETLQAAKLSFVCSAHYLDHVSALHMTTEQRSLLDSIKDLTVREDVRDMMVNQSFRRDYWVKGPRRLKPAEQLQESRAIELVLVTPAGDVSLEATGALGKASLNEHIYKPIVELMADHMPRTIGAISLAITSSTVSYAQLVEACIVLAGLGHIHLVSDDGRDADVSTASRRLNEHLIQKSRAGGDEVQWLASPLTGAAVAASRFEQIFTGGVLQGASTAEELAAVAWGVLEILNQKIIREGKALETQAENMAELVTNANVYLKDKLPVFKSLGIVPA